MRTQRRPATLCSARQRPRYGRRAESAGSASTRGYFAACTEFGKPFLEFNPVHQL
jgi:hypothetical protein